MYNELILNAFNNPKNAGRISKPDGIADRFNQDKTANVEFSLRIENGIITDCKFRAQANPYIIAVCSTITEMMKGKMVDMLLISSQAVKEALDDNTENDIDFCIDCLKDAVQDYKENLEKNNK
ncbi:MAG: iron-sulfur cluster assembly scaffold protein [Candidatus Onthoplasma sp.]